MVVVLDVPPMEDEEDDKLLKKGADLFRELVRVYPVAEVEDYFKGGQWKDDLMRTDLQLIEAHRLEAGAPDPPPLGDVKMPPLPKEVRSAAAPAKPQGLSALMGIRGGLPAAAGRAGASAAGAASPVAELRLISLFVAKWKLDATKTKLALSKLTSERRRYVIQHFRAPADGEETIKGLEKYIADCEKSKAWGPLKAAPAGGAAPAANGVHAPAGVKRPLSAVVPASQEEPNKQPKAAPAAGGAAAFLLARARQQQARPGGVVRPAGLVVGGARPVAASRPPAPAQEGLRPGPVTPRPTIPRGALISGLLQKF